MDILGIQSTLDLQKQVVSESSQKSTEDFNAILQKAVENKDDVELKEACEELESYMITQMFKQMKKSMLSDESLIPKGDYEKMFEDYNIDNQAKEMVKAGGIGLADAMYKQIVNTYGMQTQFEVGQNGQAEIAQSSSLKIDKEI